MEVIILFNELLFLLFLFNELLFYLMNGDLGGFCKSSDF